MTDYSETTNLHFLIPSPLSPSPPTRLPSGSHQSALCVVAFTYMAAAIGEQRAPSPTGEAPSRQEGAPSRMWEQKLQGLGENEERAIGGTDPIHEPQETEVCATLVREYLAQLVGWDRLDGRGGRQEGKKGNPTRKRVGGGRWSVYVDSGALLPSPSLSETATIPHISSPHTHPTSEHFSLKDTPAHSGPGE